MTIHVIGLNYRTADLNLREQLAFSDDEIPPALRRLRNQGLIEEGMILSTCNRTEVYFRPGPDLSEPNDVLRLFSDERSLSHEAIEDASFHRDGLRAVEHCFRVAGSLDSMVVGESQILGQVKSAYRLARENGFCDKFLHELFQNAFHIAKKIRTQTNISRLPSSIGSAAVALAQQIFGDLNERNVLVIGGGDMGELCLKHLREEGVGSVKVTNRTQRRARELAERYGGQSCSFDRIDEHLVDVDIVLSSTGSEDPIIEPDDLNLIREQRGSRPLFFIDIAVPRDIDQTVDERENVYLYNIDDLESVVEQNMEYREAEMERAETYVQEGVRQFEEWLKTQDMGPMIRELKQEVYQLVEEQLREELNPGESTPDKSDLQLVAHRVTNKLLDDPLNVMKQKAVEGDRETITAVREIFDLDEELRRGA